MALPSDPLPVRPKKKRKWLRRIGLLLLFLAILIALAPYIVAKTGLVNHIAAPILEDLDGTVTVGDASIGWFSPVELRDVVLKDSAGAEVVRVEKITLERSVLGMWSNAADLGTIEVDRPVLDLVCDGPTTNLEKALKKYFRPGPMPQSDRSALVVVVRDGSATIRSSAKTISRTLTGLEATVTIPKAAAEPVLVKATAKVAQAEGELSIDGSFGESGQLKLSGSQIPLDVLGLAAQRYEPTAEVGGTAATQLTVSWSKDSYSVDGIVTAANFDLAGRWLGKDRLHFAKVDLPAKFTVTGNTLAAETLKLTCDAGTLSLSGTIDLAGDLDAVARKPGLKADADVNLTKLAAALPRLFRLRPGTELSGGQLKASIAGTDGSSGTVWTGELSTSSIRAVRDGKPIVWDQPLRAGFAARLGPDNWPVFDKLEAQSDFIGLAARGSAESFVSAATIDLNKLASRLRDFVDLEGIRLEGLAEVKLNSKTAPGGFAVDAKATLTRFAVKDANGVGIHEPELALTLAALLKRETGGVRIESGKLTLAADGDSAEATLTEPFAGFASGKVVLAASGDLAHWQDRLRPFFTLPPDFALNGKGKLAGTAAVANRKIGFDGSMNVEKFAVGPPAKPTWTEPTLGLAAKGELDLAGDSIRFDRLKLERNGLAADAKGSINDISVSQDVRFDGTLAYDLAKLEPKLREFLGKGAKVSGAETRPFRLAGKLGGPDRRDPILTLSGAAAVGWKNLKAYGFDVGPADLKATLDSGVVTFSSIAATFGGGQVRLTPTLTLGPDAARLSFAKGKIIDRAKLTPAVCADAIGYVLPAIANAAKTEGLISFDLDESRVPLADPTKAYMKGTLTLHAVKVSPGPVATELANLLGAAHVTLTLANEQPVAVRIEGGRVYHDNLTIDVRGFTVKTSGSVGFDGTLNLVADLPLPSNLINGALADRPLIKDALAKKRISVTIGGTLDKPRLDPKAFQAAAQKLTQEAIKSATDDALKNGLQGLFKKK